MRLTRHFLTSPAPSPAAAASAMCGVHTQVMSAAELSLGIRTGVGATGIRDALWTDRSLVKTFGPRGTVHIFPANELSFWGAAFASLPTARSLPPELTLSSGQLDEIIGAIGTALLDRELTVDELHDEVVQRAGTWAGAMVMPAFNGMWPLWRMAIADAAYRGALCFGPQRGRKVTYTNPSRWVPPLDHAYEDPFAELALRYLASYGPATPQHFAQWLAIPKRPAAELFERLGDQLEEVSLEGTPAWLTHTTPAGPPTASTTSADLPSRVTQPAATPAEITLPPTTPGTTRRATLVGASGPIEAGRVGSGLRLLPLFDAYTVGCHPRDLLFPGAAKQRALSGGQAGNVAVILIDGTVQGIWHQKKTGKKLAITAEPFLKLSPKQRQQLEDQANLVGTLAEATPALTVGEVTARAHL